MQLSRTPYASGPGSLRLVQSCIYSAAIAIAIAALAAMVRMITVKIIVNAIDNLLLINEGNR